MVGMKNVMLLLCSCFLLCGSVLAQTDSAFISNEVETLIESQASDAELKLDPDLPDLQQFRLHPLPLNSATAEELSLLGLLTPQQIQALITHREQYGPFLLIYELQTVPGFNTTLIKIIRPYIKLNSTINDQHIPLRRLLFNGNWKIITRIQQPLELSKGFQLPDSSTGTSYYVGSPQRIYSQFRYSYQNRLSYGWIGDKDAGEAFTKGKQIKGFDFNTVHLFFRTNTCFTSVALGDYELRFGQGLTLFTGFAAGKSALVLLAKKSGIGLKPFTSANESNYFRGIATTITLHRLHFIPFLSLKKTDATLLTATDTLSNADEQLYAGSSTESGYHRTPTELQNKGSNRLLQGGCYTYWETSRLHLGLSLVAHRFAVPFLPGTAPYQRYKWYGQQLLQEGLDYAWVYRNWQCFGEIAASQPGAFALLHGVLIHFDPKVDGVLLYRNYSRSYQSLNTKAFAESSSPQNEEGLFIGLQLKPRPRWQVSTYIDCYRFPWLKYGVDAPSGGQDFLLQVTYAPNKTTEAYVRFTTKLSEASPSAETAHTGIGALYTKHLSGLRLQLTQAVSTYLTFKARTELRNVSRLPLAEAKGWAGYCELHYKQMGKPLQVTARYLYFNCSDYEARIYTYESDLLGSFSIPALSGTGYRAYLQVQYNLGRHLTLWIRGATSIYPDQNSTGSGLDLINRNHKSELKAQLRLQF